MLIEKYHLSVHLYACSCSLIVRRWKKGWWCKRADSIEIQVGETIQEKKIFQVREKEGHLFPRAFSKKYQKFHNWGECTSLSFDLSLNASLIWPSLNLIHCSLMLHLKPSRLLMPLRHRKKKSIEGKGNKRYWKWLSKRLPLKNPRTNQSPQTLETKQRPLLRWWQCLKGNCWTELYFGESRFIYSRSKNTS